MPRTKGSKNGYSKDPNYKPVGKPAKKDYSYNGKLPSVRPHYNPAEHYSNQPKASNTPTIGSIRPTASPAEKYGNKPKAYSKVSVPSIRNKKMKYYDTIRDKDGNILGKYVDEKRTNEFARKQDEYNRKEKNRRFVYNASKHDSSIVNKASSSVSIPSIRNKEMTYTSPETKKWKSDYAWKKTAEANAEQRKHYLGQGKQAGPDKYLQYLVYDKPKRDERRKKAPLKGLINKGKRKVKKLLDIF